MVWQFGDNPVVRNGNFSRRPIDRGVGVFEPFRPEDRIIILKVKDLKTNIILVFSRAEATAGSPFGADVTIWLTSTNFCAMKFLLAPESSRTTAGNPPISASSLIVCSASFGFGNRLSLNVVDLHATLVTWLPRLPVAVPVVVPVLTVLQWHLSVDAG